MSKKTIEKPIEIKYKIRMVVEIEGSIEDTKTLRDDTGIEPFVQWASDDIESALDGICRILQIKKVELEEV